MTELTISPEESTPAESKSNILNDVLQRPFIASLHLDWEKAIYLLFIIIAILSRFWGLGDRVMSHDESLHTQFSYQYYDGQGYNHTPLMHGPFLFHITSLSYWLFGASDFSARLPIAIFGIILILIPYFLRSWIGRIGALFASFFFLISPYVTYYSRYIRHDVYVIMWALIIFIAIWYYFRERKDKYLYWFGAGLALMFATKEVAFIYVAIFGSYLIIRLLVKLWHAPWFRNNLVQIRTPMLVVLAGLIIVGIGLAGQRAATKAPETAETTATTEGFAADPNAEPTDTAETENQGNLETIMRWSQIIGIGVLGLGLFLTIRAMRPELDEYPEFDLIILFTTLILPMVSPLLTTIVGWNPRDYNLNQCILDGQETMSSLSILFARMGNATCWESYFQSGIVRSGFFLMIALIISILLGLWWNRRRWLIIAVIFYAFFTLLYTSMFTNMGGFTSGIIGSLGYWLEQQAVQRGSQPIFYYLIVVPFYEFLPLIFSILAVRLWTQKKNTNEVLGYWVILLLLMFLLFSFANWVYINTIGDPNSVSEATSLPGLIVAGLVFIIGMLYWFMVRRRQIREEYELEKGVWSLFDSSSLLDFVPFVTWWLLLTWVAYTYAGEKMPWLSFHFVIPMAFLAGWYFNEKLAHLSVSDLFSRNAVIFWGLTLLLMIALAFVVGPLLLGQIQLGNQETAALTGIGRFLGSLLLAIGVIFLWQRYFKRTAVSIRQTIIILSIFTLLSLLTIRFTYMSSFPNADYTNEFMVYAHGAPATKDVVMEQIEELSMRLNGDKSIKVAFDSDVSWPFTWYLRDYPNRVFFGENPSQSLNESPVIIVGNKNWDKVEPYLGNNYQQTQHTFLWWPMEEYRQINMNAILGNPQTPAEERRGIMNANVRQALWDIFFYRDYQKYGETFGGTFTAGEWPLRHELRMYVRNDVLPTMWDYGVGAVAAGGFEDPYAEGELTPINNLVLNASMNPGTELGQLSAPRNLAIGTDGRIYVADSGNHRIQVFDVDGTPINVFGSFGTDTGQFNEPWGIAVDDEYIYVADTWNHRIQKFTLDGDFVASFGVSGSPAEDNNNGLGLFFGPRSITLLADNQLLVTDTGNHRMQLLDRNGNFVQQVGSFGNQLGQMNEPVGISQGPDGSVFLADTWNARIQQFTPELFAINEWPVAAWEGTSINNKPYTAVDSAGRVYVTDPEGFRVLVFNPNGTYLGRFGNFGTDANNFGLPNGITIDAQDNVYIADSGNNRILKFAPIFGPALDFDADAVFPDDSVAPDTSSEGDTAVEEAAPSE